MLDWAAQSCCFLRTLKALAARGAGDVDQLPWGKVRCSQRSAHGQQRIAGDGELDQLPLERQAGGLQLTHLRGFKVESRVEGAGTDKGATTANKRRAACHPAPDVINNAKTDELSLAG